MNLSIVIPAHNEATRIRDTLERYTRACRHRSAEIIVVVNGTTDGTENLVSRDFLPHHPQIRLIVIPETIGKGGALIRGFAEARGDLIGFTDADGATSPQSFLQMADALAPPSILIGSRWLPQSAVSVRQSTRRQLASRALNLIVRIGFRIPISDSQCGAKVMSRDVLQSVLPHLGATQWAFDVDLLFQIRRAGFPILEHPVQWSDREGSKVRPFRTPLEMLGALTRLRLRYSPLRFLVNLWDRSLGVRLYQRRLSRMRAIYGTPPTHEPSAKTKNPANHWF